MALAAIERRLTQIQTWAALAGKWTFDGSNATYQGPIQPQASPENPITPYGLAVSDARLRDGMVQAQVRLGSDGQTTASIVLGFSGRDRAYVLAQLGAYDRAYAISEWDSQSGHWRGLAAEGSLANLDRTKLHLLNVELQGQRIALSVDGVRVIEHLLPAPLSGDQIGLYAWGISDVQFTDVAYERRAPRVFVAMPFREPYDTVYREVIRPVADAEGIEVIRIDELAGPGIIFEDIQQHIETASIVIAEISDPNQNVFYELGYAHALNKPTILLARRGQELPFDIRSYRVIFYDDSIGGKPAVERELQRHLRAVLKNIVS